MSYTEIEIEAMGDGHGADRQENRDGRLVGTSLQGMIEESHGALSNGLSSGPKPQKNWQILIERPTCHYKCRASAAAIDRGVAKCPDPECPDFDEVMKVDACPEDQTSPA